MFGVASDALILLLCYENLNCNESIRFKNSSEQWVD